MRPVWSLALVCAGALSTGGCAQGDLEEPKPLLAADYRNVYPVVDGCRASVDHNFAYMIVRTDPHSAPMFARGPYPLPVGSVIVAEHYEDAWCSQRAGWTVMKKESAGSDPAAGDWRWARLDGQRRTIETDESAGCARCHAICRDRDFLCSRD